MPLPEYTKRGARLPIGGPDRVRFCVWYSDAIEKMEHAEALEEARAILRLFHMYAAAGIAEKVGPLAGGVPVQFIGETGEPPP